MINEFREWIGPIGDIVFWFVIVILVFGLLVDVVTRRG